jgi:hypothetical protein
MVSHSAALLLGVAVTYLVMMSERIDLLASRVGAPVTLEDSLTVENMAGATISLSEGTVLFHEKTYRGEAYLRIEVVTERLDGLDPSGTESGAYIYFSQEPPN